jgi:hypothetical protein
MTEVKSLEGAGIAASNANASSKFSTQAFSDPRDFLDTIKGHFNELGHGHEVISLADLNADVGDPNLDPKGRAAASIAAEHYGDLAGIEGQQFRAPVANVPGISASDVDFAIDMNAHHTFGYTAENLARETLGVVGSLGVAGLGGAVGGFELSTGAGLFGGAAWAPLSFGWLGVGAIGVYGVGRGFYRAFTEASYMHGVADKDSQMFRSWLEK